jgi:hypothetical protein
MTDRTKVWSCVVERMPQEELFKKYAGNNVLALVTTIIIGLAAYVTLRVAMWILGAAHGIPVSVVVSATITYVVLAYVFRPWNSCYRLTACVKSTVVYAAYYLVMLLTGELIGFALIIFGIVVTLSLLITHNTLSVILTWKDLKRWATEQKTKDAAAVAPPGSQEEEDDVSIHPPAQG